MTEYTSASSRDRNCYYSNPHLVSPHYSNGNGVNYFYPSGQLQLPATGSYASHAPTYMSSPQAIQNPMYMSNHGSPAVPYSLVPPARPYPSQPRTLSYPPYHTGTVPTQRIVGSHQMRHAYSTDLALSHVQEIESQESINQDTMLSEPMIPALEGYPDVRAFDRLMDRYVSGLSPKKQDKALISARRAKNIRTVLLDRKATGIESAQFRFWVKKMFTLQQIGSGGPKSICHEVKPVAVREKLFKILTRAHKACHHGGRDKTSAQVRRVYSWVPKELISRFVKMCPTCRIRRPSRDATIDEDVEKTSPSDEDMPDSPVCRRDSASNVKQESTSGQPRMGFSTTFAQQNRWMTDLPNLKTKQEFYDSMAPSAYDRTHTSTDMSAQYTARLSEQMNAMSFPPAEVTSPTGFPSSNIRSTGNWQSFSPAYDTGYTSKQERRPQLKQEHHY